MIVYTVELVEFMDIRLLEKFFRKECTPEEAIQVMKWFRHQKLQSDQEEQLRELWETSELEKENFQTDGAAPEILRDLYRKMEMADNDVFLRSERKRGASRRITYRVMAAALLLIGIFGAWLFVAPLEENKAEEPVEITLTAPQGVKLTKVLPDGSKVILNSNSSVTYSDGFTEDKRELKLQGEAFFQVAKDPFRPFQVRLGDGVATALGTSFNVTYNSLELATELSLVTGKVQLEVKINGTTKAVKLNPGEKARYVSTSDSIQLGAFDVHEVLAWKDGVLYFKDADFNEVITRLENWYGVKVTPEGNLVKAGSQNWTYTGRFENESLDNVLTGIGFVKDFTFEINGKEVKLLFH